MTVSYWDDAKPPEEEEIPVVEEEQVPPELTVEEETLLTKGYFTTTVNIGVHKVVLRTLRVGEELEAALVADKYKDTVEGSRALMIAHVAAAIESVDGRQLIPVALGKADRTLEAKFNYVADNWYWVTIRKLYDEYSKILDQSLKVYDSIKKD